MFAGGALAVQCGSCSAIVAAPPGHSVVRCGHCNAILRLAPMAARRRTPHEIQEEMRRAADAARKAAEESNRASDDAISRCPVFCADEAFAAQGLECPISTEAIVVGDKVLKMPCGVSGSGESAAAVCGMVVVESLRLRFRRCFARVCDGVNPCM